WPEALDCFLGLRPHRNEGVGADTTACTPKARPSRAAPPPRRRGRLRPRAQALVTMAARPGGAPRALCFEAQAEEHGLAAAAQQQDHGGAPGLFGLGEMLVDLTGLGDRLTVDLLDH